MPSRWQAIIWINDGVVYLRIYVSLSLNELKQCDFFHIFQNAHWHSWTLKTRYEMCLKGSNDNIKIHPINHEHRLNFFSLVPMNLPKSSRVTSFSFVLYAISSDMESVKWNYTVPDQSQAINQTNDVLLSTGPTGTNSSDFFLSKYNICSRKCI